MKQIAAYRSIEAHFPEAAQAALEDLRARSKRNGLCPEDCAWHYEIALQIPVYTGEEALKIAFGEIEPKPVGHPFDRVGLAVCATLGSKMGAASIGEPGSLMLRERLPAEVIQFFEDNRGFYNMPLDPAVDGPGAGSAWLESKPDLSPEETPGEPGF